MGLRYRLLIALERCGIRVGGHDEANCVGFGAPRMSGLLSIGLAPTSLVCSCNDQHPDPVTYVPHFALNVSQLTPFKPPPLYRLFLSDAFSPTSLSDSFDHLDHPDHLEYFVRFPGDISYSTSEPYITYLFPRFTNPLAAFALACFRVCSHLLSHGIQSANTRYNFFSTPQFH